MADSPKTRVGSTAEPSKKAAALAEKAEASTEPAKGKDRGPGASRGAKTKPPRGNRARKAAEAQKELDEAAAKKATDSGKDSADEEEEEDDDAAKSLADEVFWKHLVWGAYRSRKTRDDGA